MRKLVLLLVLSFVAFMAKADDKVKRPDTYNYNRGMEEMNNNNWEEALDYFNKELSDNPKNGYAYAWIGTIHANQGENGRALSAIDNAIKLIPKKDAVFLSGTYSIRGQVYCELKDTVKALSDFAMTIKLAPKEVDGYEKRAQIYYEQQKYDMADADYLAIKKIDQGSVISYMGIGRDRMGQKRWEEAIEQFSYVTNLFSDYSSAYSYRAEAYLALEKWNEATDDIVTALKIDYDNKAYYMMQTLESEAQDLMLTKLKVQCNKNDNVSYWPYCVGVIYENSNQYQKAVEWYSKSNEVESSAAALQRIASCQYYLRNYESALTALEKAINLDSTDASNLPLKAYILADMERVSDSKMVWDELVSLYPESARVYFERGCFLRNINDVEGALDDFMTAVTLAPEVPAYLAMRADAYSALGMSEKAKADYQKITEIEAKDGTTSFSAYAFVAFGDYTKAIEIVDSILEKTEDLQSDYYTAACIYSRMGDKAKALDYLEKSLENGYNNFKHIYRDYDMDFLRSQAPNEFRELMMKYDEPMKNDGASITIGAFDVAGEEETVSEIPFTKENGVCNVRCEINGLPLYFVFDTGASTVSLSMVEATFMMKNGYLQSKDVVGNQRFQDANGNVSEGTVINLRKVQFGDVSLDNVRASVVRNQKAPLLLGQSVLSRIGKVELDNQKSVVRVKCYK